MRERIARPDCELAYAFTVGVCDNPACGLHLTPTRIDGTPICEIVIGRGESLLRLLAYIHDEGLDLQ